MNILICEDNESKYELVRLAITENNPTLNITWAKTFQEAKDKLNSDERYHVGIFDNNMPMSKLNLHMVGDCGILLADLNRRTDACEKSIILTSDNINPTTIEFCQKRGEDVTHIKYNAMSDEWKDTLNKIISDKRETQPVINHWFDSFF